MNIGNALQYLLGALVLEHALEVARLVVVHDDADVHGFLARVPRHEELFVAADILVRELLERHGLLEGLVGLGLVVALDLLHHIVLRAGEGCYTQVDGYVGSSNLAVPDVLGEENGALGALAQLFDDLMHALRGCIER
jgi:hypothetical protein